MASASNSWQSAAISFSSSREKTLPVGLLGVLTMMALVRGEKARRSSSGSKLQSGAMQRDQLSLGPAQQRVGAVVLVERLEDDHFVARVGDGQQ